MQWIACKVRSSRVDTLFQSKTWIKTIVDSGSTERSSVEPLWLIRIVPPVRTVLAMMLVMAKQGVWVLEQPSTSLVFRLRRFQKILRMCRASWMHNQFSFVGTIWLVLLLHAWFIGILWLKDRPAQVYKQSFWMRAYGAATPKRTTLWSNSTGVRFFATSKQCIQKMKAAKGPKLADSYIDHRGHKRFKGNRFLKKSQHRPHLIFADSVDFP